MCSFVVFFPLPPSGYIVSVAGASNLVACTPLVAELMELLIGLEYPIEIFLDPNGALRYPDFEGLEP